MSRRLPCHQPRRRSPWRRYVLPRRQGPGRRAQGTFFEIFPKGAHLSESLVKKAK
jgi:hypothetical protein